MALREMTGSSEFCEVFLDDVVVPDRLVPGEVDRGWDVVSSGLSSERGYVGANVVQLEVLFDDLVALARSLSVDGVPALEQDDVRHRLAGLRSEVDAVRTSAAEASESPAGAAALVAKLTYTELNVRLCQAAMDLLADGRPDRPDADHLRDNWFHHLLWSRALTISGGSSEIVRSLIAQQLLGLPRSWSRKKVSS